MTDTTTSVAPESADPTPDAAPTITAPPAATAAASADESAPAPAAEKPARRWKTLTLAITGIIALVLGLGIGGASGWAIANAQRPGFGNGMPGQFPGDGDGQFPGDGQRPDGGQGGPGQQQGDDTGTGSDTGSDTSS